MAFIKKKGKKTLAYDSRKKQPVLRCSICTGEQTAGLLDIATGHFEEIMLVRNQKDLNDFMKMVGVTEIKKEY